MILSDRELNYFVSLTGKLDIHALYEAGYLNEKAVRNHLIREEYYRLLRSMRSGDAVAKLANDKNLSEIMVHKIIANGKHS
jgi:hypothetical protein